MPPWKPSRPFNDLFVLGMTNTKAREMLDSGYRMPAPEGTTDEMYKLMLKCWNYEAEARPHFKEIHSKIDIQFSRYVFELCIFRQNSYKEEMGMKSNMKLEIYQNAVLNNFSIRLSIFFLRDIFVFVKITSVSVI